MIPTPTGSARLETTAIYASAIGDKERNLARRAWKSLEIAIQPHAGCPTPHQAEAAIMRD
jgi:hypothetical protein